MEEIRKRYSLLKSPTKILCEWNYKDYQSTGEMETLIRTIKEAKRYSEGINSNFYFVYLGSVNSLVNKCNYAKEEIITILKSADIKVIDTTSIFSTPSPRYELFSLGQRGGHYSKKGYFEISHFIDKLSQ